MKSITSHLSKKKKKNKNKKKAEYKFSTLHNKNNMREISKIN